MQPRWRKVLADIRGNKTRTILVVLSIAVGVFAVGFVTSAYEVLLNDMDKEFKAVNPSEAAVYTDEFDEDLLESLKTVPGVKAVEGRTTIFARTKLADGSKALAFVIAVPSVSSENWSTFTEAQKKVAFSRLDKMEIDVLRPHDPPGALPPLKEHEIYVERSCVEALNAKVGDDIDLELDSGHVRRMRVAGIVHDITSPPFVFTNYASIFVNKETMVWLEASRDFNTVKIRVAENNTDENHVKDIARAVADKIEKSGREIYFTYVNSPGRHWGSDITQALLLVMGILGFLSVLLSGFLVLNTISSLLSQHVRQIGIMKAVGGKRYQVMMMYFILVLTFGILALIIAGAPGILAGYAVAQFIAGFLNFNLGPLRAPTTTVALEILVAIGTPLLAATLPVINGTRVTIREAISEYGLGKGHYGQSMIDRLMERVQSFSRPVLISLRNTFRRKSRLALTLFTLTLAGATFIGVFNTQAAIMEAIFETMGYYMSDVNVTLDDNHRIQQIEPIVMNVKGVQAMEGWGYASGQFLSLDEKTSKTVDILAPPNDAKLIEPIVTSGRWLLPDDQNALIIGNSLLKVRPDLKIGDQVRLEINGRKHWFTIVGTYRMPGTGLNPFVFANYDHIARITHQTDQYSNLRIVTDVHDSATQDRVKADLEAAFEREGWTVEEITTRAQNEDSNHATVNVIILFLLVMAILIAVVGGLGLTSTMSMNVMERVREIGVMRSTGASDGTIMQIVLTEGMLIGLISWAFGALLAMPISIGLNAALGESLLGSAMPFQMNLIGYIAWLVVVLVISGLASAMPARSASLLTIREVLAYE